MTLLFWGPCNKFSVFLFLDYGWCIGNLGGRQPAEEPGGGAARTALGHRRDRRGAAAAVGPGGEGEGGGGERG